MRASIIIPTLNEGPAIAQAVDRAWAAGPAEVLVVDGGSRDDTLHQAAAASHVLSSPKGRGRQLNAGADASTGDVLLFLHADNWLDPSGVDQILAVLHRRPDVLCGGFLQQIDAPGPIYRCLEHGNACRVIRWGLCYGDQGIFVRRSAFDAVGGFPPTPIMEDLAFMRTLARTTRPVLLPGPLHVSPRRWIEHGVVRQTLRNWTLAAAFRFGASPDRLARFYPSHRPTSNPSRD